MKRSIFTVLIIFATIQSFAGSLNQDPEISQLRLDFINASVPTPRDIKIGNRWNCLFRTTEANKYGQELSSISFNRLENQYHAILWQEGGYQSPVNLNFGLMDFVMNRGLYGAYNDGTRIYSSFTLVKKEHNGNLLIEQAGDLVARDPAQYWKDRFEAAPEAVLGNRHKALLYGRCTPSL